MHSTIERWNRSKESALPPIDGRDLRQHVSRKEGRRDVGGEYLENNFVTIISILVYYGVNAWIIAHIYIYIYGQSSKL